MNSKNYFCTSKYNINQYYKYWINLFLSTTGLLVLPIILNSMVYAFENNNNNNNRNVYVSYRASKYYYSIQPSSVSKY